MSPPLGESHRFWVLVVSAVLRPNLVTAGKKEQSKISNDTLIIKVNLLNKLSLTFLGNICICKKYQFHKAEIIHYSLTL